MEDNTIMDVEIFRAGDYGDGQLYTTKHIQEFVDNYDPKFQEAPVVLGHPWEDNVPAFGWVISLFKKGKSLWASMELLPELVELIKSKKYKKRSVRIARDFELKNGEVGHYLLHVGWLGAALPRVAGMRDIKLSYSDNTKSDVIEFDDFDVSISDNEKDIKKKEVDNNMATFTQEQHDSLLEAALNKAGVNFEKMLTEKTEEFKTEIEDLKKNVTNYKADIEKKDKEIDNLNEAKTAIEVENFVSGLIGEGKLAPTEKENQVEILKKVAKDTDLFTLQKKALSERPKILELGTKNEAGENPELKDEKDKEEFARKHNLNPESVKKYYGKDSISMTEGGTK